MDDKGLLEIKSLQVIRDYITSKQKDIRFHIPDDDCVSYLIDEEEHLFLYCFHIEYNKDKGEYLLMDKLIAPDIGAYIFGLMEELYKVNLTEKTIEYLDGLANHIKESKNG